MTPRSMTWAAASVLAAGSVLLASCDSGGSTTSSTDTVVSTTVQDTVDQSTTPPTTPLTTPSTSTSTSSVSTSSISPTTSPPTTEAPSSTLDGPAVLDQVSSAILDFVDVVNEAYRDPSSPERREEIRASSTDPLTTRLIGALDSFVERNRAARPNPDQPATASVIPETLSFGTDETVAALDACVVETDLIVSIDEQGVEEVVKSDVDAILIVYTLVFDGQVWKVQDLVVDQQFEDQVTCE